jgi:hypothetical protein
MEDDLVRRKRVDTNGEWEYECRQCDKWLPKEKFRGCREYIDAYGNCLMCSQCRAQMARNTKSNNEQHYKEIILNALGFYDFKNSDEFMEHLMKKHLKNHK